MTNQCPDWEVLATPESWSGEVRAHVAGCARCTAWRREHEVFVAGDPAIAPAERARAEARLTAFTRELTGADAPAVATRAGGGGFFARLFGPLFAPPLRLAGALAVIAIVSAVVVARRDPPARVGEATRGGRAEAATTVAFGARGDLTVRWAPVSGADGYTIECFDVGGSITWIADTSATTCTLDSARAALATQVRVVAMRHGDRLRELDPVYVPKYAPKP
ncbi:MAG: hypothetical protein U0704_02585 [Candidatus Eisenbacteria bacterium]